MLGGNPTRQGSAAGGMEVGRDGRGSGHSLSGGSSSQRCEVGVTWGDACRGKLPTAPQLLLGTSASAAGVVPQNFLQLVCVDDGSYLFFQLV